MNLSLRNTSPERRRASGTILALVAGASLLAAALAGCGGSGSSSGSSSAATGRATLKITWPSAAARLVPVASSSVVVSFLNGTSVVSSQTVARPTGGTTSTTTFTGLPAGTLTLRAQAFPTTTGAGTPQASASKGVTIVAGGNTPLAITMASTISSISIAPSNPSVAIGATTTVTATALDANGATVLTPAFTYASSNNGVATVNAAGVVTGVAAGTATITATESESGKSSPVTVTVTLSSSGGGNTVVDLANAYLSSLTPAQQAATLVAGTGANAAKWSSLIATPSGTLGTNDRRNGVAYSSLTTVQKTAWTRLVNAALTTTQPGIQFSQIRASDNYLGGLQSGYSGDYEYIGIVGTPSANGSWLLQIGGHNIANNYAYTGSTLNATTPYFLGVEPQSFAYGGTTYTPLAAQRNGMYNLINSLTAGELAQARLNGTFSEVLLGPGNDARSSFPDGTTGRGILASSLTDAQKTLIKNAIRAWTQDSALNDAYQALYESEIDDTYVAYAGTTTFNNQGDYVRIDGPHVWIEFLCQNGTVVPGQIRFSTVWRDRETDYNAAYGF